MRAGRARPPGAPQRYLALILAATFVLIRVYNAWAHCSVTVSATPAKVCVGETVTVTQSGVDCQGQSVNQTNTTSYGSTGQQIICPNPACGGCGIDNCATVMVVAVSGIAPSSATVCAGGSNTFTITTDPAGQTLPHNPDWTVDPSSAGSIVGSGTSVVFVAANTGVVATVTAGCGSSSASATVTILTNLWGGWAVSNAPSISLTVSGEVASCASTTATFTANISTNTGLRYRSDVNGCATTNEVSDLVLTNLVTTWSVTDPNAASGSGTQATFTVSNAGTNVITFTTSGETLDPAGSYSTNAVATNVSYVVTLTPLDTNTCINCTNYFVATAAPAGSGTFTWNPAGVVTYSPDGTVSSNAVVFTTAGLAQLVSVTYGGCSQTATANVFEVQSVVWEQINRPLSANNHPTGTVGVKMFPDKDSPSDTAEARTVRVVATVNPPTNGIPIYFRVLDVDDPSTNASPVDANDTTVGVGAGGDNRSDGTGTPNGGALSASSALSFYSGSGIATASVVLTVSRQPGNNFRVAASCDAGSLAKLSVTNSIPDTIYVPGDSAPVAAFNTGKITELLTVWRRLWIERDSMSSVSSNKMSVLGWVDKTSLGVPDNYWFKSSGIVGVSYLPDNDEYEGGRLRFLLTTAGVTTTPFPDFLVLKNKSGFFGTPFGRWKIAVYPALTTTQINQIKAATTAQFRMWDDDNFGIFNSPRFADYGSILPQALSKAYVVPTNADTSAEGNIINTRPFIRQLTTSQLYFTLNNTADLASLQDRWATLLVSCFEPDKNIFQIINNPFIGLISDYDPDGVGLTPVPFPGATPESNTDDILYGASPHTGQNVSAVFLEILRDFHDSAGSIPDEPHVSAHEIGHTAGSGVGHPSGNNLMNEDPGIFGNSDQFRDEEIQLIRSLYAW